MTINEQHIMMLGEAQREATILAEVIGQAKDILARNPGPRNDIHSKQISLLIAEVMRSAMRGKSTADILHSLLRIVRPDSEGE